MNPTQSPTVAIEPENSPNWFWKTVGWTVLGLITLLFIGKLTMLILLAVVGCLVVGVVQTMAQRKAVSWKNVKENGVAAANGLGKGCRWAALGVRDGACYVWEKGAPAVKVAREKVAVGWNGCCSRARYFGSILLETACGAGFGGLGGGALSYGGGISDSAIPVCALVGAALGFLAGAFWSRRDTT